MMSSEARRRSGWRHLALALLLLLPPAARVVLEARRGEWPAEAARPAVQHPPARREEPDAAGLAVSATTSSLGPGYQVLLADRLPLSDPSARRSMLWAALEGAWALGAGAPGDPWALLDTAAVAGGALAGRVQRLYPRLSLIRVQSLLDPEFRVGFLHAGASGMLWGTGQNSEGHPLLEIRHLSESVELEAGENVYTAGNDGVYPTGVLIGSLVALDDAIGAGRQPWMVRAALRVESLSRLEIPIDRARERLLEALRIERQEERP